MPPLCRPGHRRIPAAVWDATVQARGLREAAEADARALLSHAAAECEALRISAVERGRAEGLGETTELRAAAVLERDRLLADARGELVELAFAIAGSVVGSIVEQHRDLVVALAGRALEQARARIEVTVHAHPSDLAALRAAGADLAARLARARRIRFVEDASIAPGGVVVETDRGRVDGRIESQLEALRRAVESVRDPGARGP